MPFIGMSNRFTFFLALATLILSLIVGAAVAYGMVVFERG